jgi:hypothetical protein
MEISLNWHFFLGLLLVALKIILKCAIFEVLESVLMKIQDNVFYSYHTHTT